MCGNVSEIKYALLALFTGVTLKSVCPRHECAAVTSLAPPFTEHDPGPTIVHVKAIWNVLVVAHLKPFVTVLLLK